MLIDVAKRHYEDFKVPTSQVSSVKMKRYYTSEQKADLDIKTSVNKIGEIVNLSQQLNSLLWDRLNKGATLESCQELYNDICILAVLSGIEIDRAKKEFIINSGAEIMSLKKKYKITDDDKTVKPQFFKMITMENGFQLSNNTRYRYFNTSMDYLQKIISRFNFREGRECKRAVIPFMSIVKEPPNNVRQGYYYAQRDKIIETIRAASEERRKLFAGYDFMSQTEKETVWRTVGEIKQDCIDEIEKMSGCPATMYLVLKDLDSPEHRDVAKFVFEVVFGKPDETFFTMILDSKEDVYTLVEDGQGDIDLYGFKFSKIALADTQNRLIS